MSEEPDTVDLLCQSDLRRDAVRNATGRNGIDYVEVTDGPPTNLYVYFLGKLPPEFASKRTALAQYLKVAGGDRITPLKILTVTPQQGIDAEHDDFLVVTLDQVGDFSAYTLSLIGVAGIDPQYASASFTFRIDCASDLDCKPACDCAPPALDEPTINYLAKDYASFRQLIFDRMALLMPDWTERHVPDLGVTLVELLAYVGDYLSYYQDAVATEAYLGTARERISVRRHARLVDYYLHEGCNARAWVQVAVSETARQLASGQISFITGANQALGSQPAMLDFDKLQDIPSSDYEYFEPLVASPTVTLTFREAHNRIAFYTWGQRECCLPAGSTRATLRDTLRTDADATNPTRGLNLQVGDVLIFEEVLGAKTGVAADADPKRRWAVRLTRVQASDDPLYPATVDGGHEALTTVPTPLVEIAWAVEDALPFAFCISAIGAPPNCSYLTDISVARGNIVLVDHGRTLDPEPLPPVPGSTSAPCCECEGHPST